MCCYVKAHQVEYIGLFGIYEYLNGAVHSPRTLTDEN